MQKLPILALAFSASATLLAQSPSHALNALPSSNVFIENEGQWDSKAKFFAQAPGVDMWITDEGAVMDFHKSTRNGRRGDVVKMSFEDRSPVAGEIRRPGRLNYFIGNDRRRWASNVGMYSEVSSQPNSGVGARYYFEGGKPRYDLIAAPGTNPSRLAMRVTGAKSMHVLKDSSLRVDTSVGSFDESGLVAYQPAGFCRRVVPCKMVVQGDEVLFKIGVHDRHLPVIIDPLISSVCVSDDNLTQANAVAIDASGNAVIAGVTNATDFPVSVGPYQSTNRASGSGGTNAFVATVSVDGATLLEATYLGGSSFSAGGDVSDRANAVGINDAGNIVVAGTASSTDFPTTLSAYQRSNLAAAHNGSNAFVAEISADGSSLLASTYVGGSESDVPNAIALDSAGDAVITGATDSKDYPTTPGAFQSTNNDEGWTVFISVVKSDCTQLLASTYLGGSLGDQAYAIALDSSENVFITGGTQSTDFPVTPGAFQQSVNVMGAQNAFVSELNLSLTSLLASTYLGGNTSDIAFALALDGQGNVFVGGETNSSNFPTSTGAFQTVKAGNQNAFVAKLNAKPLMVSGVTTPTLGNLLASTYLGGDNGLSADAGDQVNGIAVDTNHNVVLTGYTGSTNFPTTVGAYQTLNNAANTQATNQNIFVANLSSDCTSLLASTYFGGDARDVSKSIALDANGYAVVVGSTSSDNFPITTGAADTSMNEELFVLRLNLLGMQFTGNDSGSIPGGAPAPAALNVPPTAKASTVWLKSSNAVVAVPGTASVVKGVASFTVTSLPVSADTTVTVTATAGKVTNPLSVKVLAAKMTGFAASSVPVVGGSTANATITLAGAAIPSAGDPVSISSNNAAVTVPTSVKVGSSGTASFAFVTHPVNATTVATLTAKFNGITKTVKVTVSAPTLASLTPAAYEVVGGASLAGTAALNGTTASLGATLTLSSTGPVSIPSTIKVLPGAKSASFSMGTFSVSTLTNVSVTATYGVAKQTLSFVIEPLAVARISFSPSTVIGGFSVRCTLDLNAPAGVSGAIVSLTTQGPVHSPPKVTVAAGATSVSFTLTTSEALGTQRGVVLATLGSTKTAGTVTVLPMFN